MGHEESENSNNGLWTWRDNNKQGNNPEVKSGQNQTELCSSRPKWTLM